MPDEEVKRLYESVEAISKMLRAAIKTREEIEKERARIRREEEAKRALRE